MKNTKPTKYSRERSTVIHHSGSFKNYSTVTDLARFLGLSTSNPFSFEI